MNQTSMSLTVLNSIALFQVEMECTDSDDSKKEETKVCFHGIKNALDTLLYVLNSGIYRLVLKVFHLVNSCMDEYIDIAGWKWLVYALHHKMKCTSYIT